MVSPSSTPLLSIAKSICRAACPASEPENDFANRHTVYPNPKIVFEAGMQQFLTRKLVF
jgi:hypothetical protein